MPCKDPSHRHDWPDKGTLIIQKCERWCGYCTGEAAEHEWKFPWFLRRHVRTVHTRPDDHPKITVSDEWGSTQANSGASGSKKRASPVKTKTSAKKTKVNATTTPTRAHRGRRVKSPEFSEDESELSELSDLGSDSSEEFQKRQPKLLGRKSTATGSDPDEVSQDGRTEILSDNETVDAGAAEDSDPGLSSIHITSPDTPHTAAKLQTLRRDLSGLGISQNIYGGINPALLTMEHPIMSATPSLSRPGTRSPFDTSDFPVTQLSRAPQSPGETAEEATARHLSVLDIKLAYRTALQDLAQQGQRCGLTPIELGLVTADEVDRLMLLGNSLLVQRTVPHNTPIESPQQSRYMGTPVDSVMGDQAYEMMAMHNENTA